MNGLGQLLAGVAACVMAIIAIVSLIVSMRARREAAEAKKASPTAQLEALRQEVKSLVESYGEGVSRHITEREGLERALRAERERADGAELVAVQAQAQAALYRIDLAEVRGELAELKTRFEASIASRAA